MSQQIVQGGRRFVHVQCIINGQQPGGGFDYGWKKESRRDTSLGGWCCQAVKAANIADAENQGLHEAMVFRLRPSTSATRTPTAPGPTFHICPHFQLF